MTIFNDVLTRAAMLLLLVASLPACEEEPQMERPVDDPPAQAADKPAEPAAEAQPAQTEPGATPAPATPAGASAGDVPPSRVPTASQLLGLGGPTDRASADALPDFIRARKPSEDSALFSGDPVRPSSQYTSMRLEISEVSPLERHWGATDELSDEARRRQLLMNSMAAPSGPDDTRIFAGDLPTAAEPEAQAPKAQAHATGDPQPFHLVMYRLNPKTGAVETFDRRYASEAAMTAAKRFASGQGYQDQRPTDDDVKNVRNKADQAKPQAQQDTCRHKAQWVEGGIQQSRCFDTQEALQAFTQARLEQIRKAAQPADKPAAQDAQQPQGGIQPVKLGQ